MVKYDYQNKGGANMLKFGDVIFIDSMECSYFSGVAVYHGDIGDRMRFFYVGSGIEIRIPKSMIGKDVRLCKVKEND